MNLIAASEYFNTLNGLLQKVQVTDRSGTHISLNEGTQLAIKHIHAMYSTKNKIMIIGNGGSAAIASHVHNDLSKSVGIRSMVFTEPPLLTALSNDLSYHVAFENQIELWADRNDLLIAVSSSGGSENILRAVTASIQRQCKTITLSGFKENNPLRGLGDVNFYVPSSEYGYVETSHSALLHYFTDVAGSMLRR